MSTPAQCREALEDQCNDIFTFSKMSLPEIVQFIKEVTGIHPDEEADDLLATYNDEQVQAVLDRLLRDGIDKLP